MENIVFTDSEMELLEACLANQAFEVPQLAPMEVPVDFRYDRTFQNDLWYQEGQGNNDDYREEPMDADSAAMDNNNADNRDNGTEPTVHVKARRFNHKFKAEEVTLEARAGPIARYRTVGDMMALLRIFLNRILMAVITGLDGNDLVRFCLFSDHLDKPISTGLSKVSQVSAEWLATAVSKVLQSKQGLALDDQLRVDAITVRNPSGGGRSKIYNVDLNRLTKKSIVTTPKDALNLCCARAIVVTMAKLDNDCRYKNIRDGRRGLQKELAKQLHARAGVPEGPCSFTEIAQFERHLDVQIKVFSGDELGKIVYKGPTKDRKIYLFYHQEHFDAVVNPKALVGSQHYCDECDKGYEHHGEHHCSVICGVCYTKTCVPGTSMQCPDCHRFCRSQECFKLHKTMTAKQVLSMCQKYIKCLSCGKVYTRAEGNHVCGTTKCVSCKEDVDASTHLCYLQLKEPKAPSDKIIYYDFETDQSSGEHQVNYAVAQYYDGREKVFKGYNALVEFCKFLFSPAHKGFTAIAHNAKAFDAQFILRYLLENTITPTIIPNGSKLMSIIVPRLKIRLIDSFSFLPMGLAKFPKTFGCAGVKGYFPHIFNTEANQTYVGQFPDVKYYAPDMMSSTDRDAFYKWHGEQQDQIFDFQVEMYKYCSSDVTILRTCCNQFRRDFLTTTGVDHFEYVTISSACMAVYRSQHMTDNTIGMVPVHGYVKRVNHSVAAIHWLDWVAHKDNIVIKHARNGTGEVKIAGQYVDGFCEATNTVFQFHGCFFHGCGSCYEGDQLNTLTGSSMGELLEKTKSISQKIRDAGYTLVEMWEHAFLSQRKSDPELCTFISAHSLVERLNPRDAFYGGRTNAVKLYHQGPAHYYDFTSLYPYTNKYCEYPIGHPRIVTENFKSLEQYFGIVKCTILPPRRLYHPVLPYRSGGKLNFPLCRTCVEGMEQGTCNHTDQQRALTGTWITEEVKKALQLGYNLLTMHEVYHFEQTSNTLFRSYIDQFLKLKQEASGWPSECTDDVSKSVYIKAYHDKEGITLDPSKIALNPGLRQVAKLCLNSFWGRWGMAENKVSLNFVTEYPEFQKILQDPARDVSDVYMPTDNIAALSWKHKEEFMPQRDSTNVFLAAFTTAWARLKLYAELENLGEHVLYFDTDSVIFSSNSPYQPELGNFLGELTSELSPGEVIETFVSGGPKNYAYETSRGKRCCKIRGFTLNHRNSLKLNYDTVKSLVQDLNFGTHIDIDNPAKITRDGRTRQVLNKEEHKNYRLVYHKRVIQPDYTTLPYGY